MSNVKLLMRRVGKFTNAPSIVSSKSTLISYRRAGITPALPKRVVQPTGICDDSIARIVEKQTKIWNDFFSFLPIVSKAQKYFDIFIWKPPSTSDKTQPSTSFQKLLSHSMAVEMASPLGVGATKIKLSEKPLSIIKLITIELVRCIIDKKKMATAKFYGEFNAQLVTKYSVVLSDETLSEIELLLNFNMNAFPAHVNNMLIDTYLFASGNTREVIPILFTFPHKELNHSTLQEWFMNMEEIKEWIQKDVFKTP
jgi:hypothetical protein